MVEGSPSYRKRKRDNPTPSRSSDRDQCLTDRVGCSLPRNQDWGPMVSSGAATAHQHARAQGRHVCSQGFHEGPTEDPCSPKDGQHITPGLYQTNGRNPVPEFDESDLREVGLVSPEGYHPFGISPTSISNQTADWESREVQTSAEWKLNARSFRKICTYLRKDLFATQLNAQLDNYISWIPDPGAMLSDQLERAGGVCFSAICSDRQMFAESKSRAEYHSFGSTSIAEPSVVSHATRFSSRASLLLAHSSDLLLDPKNQPYPLVCTNRLRLAAWKKSSNNTQQQEFQKKLQPCYLQDGAQAPTLPTKLDGNGGVAGVREGRLIPFHAEYNLS